MITSVSGIKTPSYAFKGASKTDNTPKEKREIKDVSGEVDKVTKEVSETVDSLSDGMESITKGVGTLGTSAVGMWAIFSKPANWVANTFSDVIIENGEAKVAQVLDKEGKVVDKIVRKANWKKIGIAGAIAAGIVATIAIVKAVKDKNVAKEAEAKAAAEAAANETAFKAKEAKEKPPEVEKTEGVQEEDIQLEE